MYVSDLEWTYFIQILNVYRYGNDGINGIINNGIFVWDGVAPGTES